MKIQTSNVLSEQMEQRVQEAQETAELAAKLAKDLNINWIQAYIVAGDQVHAERVSRQVKSGETSAMKALWLIGSYARFNWAIENLTEKELFKVLPELWISSDPEDGVDKLEIWKKAFDKHGDVICDDAYLPERKVLTVYRGQHEEDLGISWTLDHSIAHKFAKTGGQRVPIAGGKVYTAYVKREDVLAYLTGRGESELIVDPAKLYKITARDVY